MEGAAAPYGEKHLNHIEHDPDENRKYPNYGEKQWAKDKFGTKPTPKDLLWYLVPIAAVAVALFLMRGY